MAKPVLIASGYYPPTTFAAAAPVTLDVGTGAGRIVLAMVFLDSATGALDPVSCDVGGVAMTAQAIQSDNNAVNRHSRFFWQNTGLPSGSQTVTGTVSAGTRKPGMLVLVYKDTDGGTLGLTGYNFSGTVGANASASVTTVNAASLALTMLYDDAAASPTVVAGTSLVYENNLSGLCCRAYAKDGVAGTTTLGWTYPGGNSPNKHTVSLNGSTAATVITGPGGATGTTATLSQAENIGAVFTYTASQSVTWTKSGPDAALFTLGSGTGVLAFITAPDFETPTDAGANNVYDVTITATDGGGGAVSQALALTIVNANEAPSFTGPSIASLSGVAGAAITVGSLASKFTDPDSGDTGTYTKGGTWPTGPTLSTAGVLGGVLPAVGTYSSLTVIRTDASGLTATSNAFSITATAPAGTYSITVAGFGLNSGSGTLLGAAVAYTLWPGVDTGAVGGVVPIDGTATTHATTGALTITGLVNAGPHLLSIKRPDGTGRWEVVATAA